MFKLPARHRLALTGTPVENRLTDLWSIFNFVHPGYLDTQARFRKRFEIPVQRDNDPVQTATLKRLVEPFILRRVKTDKAIIADLPDKVEALQYCHLSKEQAALYEGVVRDVERQLDEKEGIERQGLMLSTLMKLKQVCNHPAQFLQDGSAFTPARSHKLERLQEMLDEVMAAGDSALIFSQFTEIGAQLDRLLRHDLALPHLLPPWRHRAHQARGHDRRVPGPADRALDLHPIAQGRRGGHHPDQGQPRLPFRPLVEPGGGGPGERPGLPHRSEDLAAAARPQGFPGHPLLLSGLRQSLQAYRWGLLPLGGPTRPRPLSAVRATRPVAYGLAGVIEPYPLGRALAGVVDDRTLPLVAADSYYTRPLPASATPDYRSFWQGRQRLPTEIEPATPAAVPAILVKKAGDFPPFWDRDGSFVGVMEEVYLRVRTRNKDAL